MKHRENQSRPHSIRFNGNELTLAVNIVTAVEPTIDIIYYLMNNGGEEAFVLMLISAENVEMSTLLEKEKRDTDILFEIDKDESIYLMLCQDTKVDGGYRFAERIIRNIVLDNGSDIYCTIVSKEGNDIYFTELEVRTTKYIVKDVILKLVESYIKTKQENKSGEIAFRSLN